MAANGALPGSHRMKITDLINEALPLSTAKKYTQAWDPNFHKDVFERQTRKDKRANRIYLPFEEAKRKEVIIPSALMDYLASAIPLRPYTTDSDLYIKGLAKETNNATRTIGIGKMLATSMARSKDPQQQDQLNKLKLAFDKDPQRAATRKSDLLIAISRHPYDVAGMSTDRGWSSCMNLVDGENRRYVLRDVKQGSIIAYLIRSDDLNITRPMSRMLIKPYAEKGNPRNLVMMGDVVYGTSPHGFKPQVDEWIDQNYNRGKSGLFCLKAGLYRDNIPQQITLINDEDIKNMTVKQLAKVADTEDTALWPRIVKLRPRDSDTVFNELIKKNRPDAISFVKNVDLEVFKQHFKRDSDVFQYLAKQDPELVDWVLAQHPSLVTHVKQRTPSQQELVITMVEKNPHLIRSVINPTKKQLLTVIKLRPHIAEWALQNHASQFDDAELMRLLYQVINRGDPDFQLLNMMVLKFPELKKDPKFVKAVTTNARHWATEHMTLDANTAQDLAISFLKDYGSVDPKVTDVLRRIDPSEGKPELIKQAMSNPIRYEFDENVVSIVINWDPEIVNKYLPGVIKFRPSMILQIKQPTSDQIKLAIQSDYGVAGDGGLRNKFDYETHKSMWDSMIKENEDLIIWAKNPSRALLKSAIDAAAKKSNSWLLQHLMNQVDVGLQVRIIKRVPDVIKYVSKPSMALQMAAVSADPTNIQLIKPRDRHPAAKAYVRTYDQEMKRLSKEDAS